MRRLTHIIPCLDIRGGRVVQGVRFRALEDRGEPAALAAAYEEAGADELALLDIGGVGGQGSILLGSGAAGERSPLGPSSAGGERSPSLGAGGAMNERSIPLGAGVGKNERSALEGTSGRQAFLTLVASIRNRLKIPLLVGGGIRSVDDAARLIDLGVDRISLGAAAVERPALLGELAARFGAERLVLSVDAARGEGGGWEVVTRGGAHRTGLEPVRWAREAAALGVGAILLTSLERDGTQSGYELDLLRAVVQEAKIPVIASGGASSAEDLIAAAAAGAAGLLAASIFHGGITTPRELKRSLAAAGIGVRS